MKKIFLASVLISTILLTAACVPPPGPGVRRGHLPPLPPPLLFPAPPLLAFWPDYDVYVCVNVSSDMVFYRGSWYRIHEGKWYRGRGHTGPWKFVPPGQIPKSLRGLPGNFRGRVKGQPHIKHNDMERNWRNWERDRKNNKYNKRNERQQKQKENERFEKKRHRDKEEPDRKDMRNNKHDRDNIKDWEDRKKRKKEQEDEKSGRGRGSRGKKK